MKIKKLSQPEQWLILGIPALFIFGSLFHFLYDLSGQNTLVGMIAPVNESVWEHLKLLLFPMILWWSVYYWINDKKYKINKEKWFFASVLAIVFSMISVIAFHYISTQAFGIESLALDIFNLFFSITVGQCIGLHYYRYGKDVKINRSVFLLIFIIAVFIMFTFNPPHLPIFKDSITGNYGI